MPWSREGGFPSPYPDSLPNPDSTPTKVPFWGSAFNATLGWLTKLVQVGAVSADIGKERICA